MCGVTPAARDGGRFSTLTQSTAYDGATGPHHKSPVKLKSVISICPGGEIGRRKGLKIKQSATSRVAQCWSALLNCMKALRSGWSVW